MHKNSRKQKIDWNQAFIFYCTLDENNHLRSLNDVSKEFHVHQRNVEKISQRNNWVENRRKAGEKAVAAFEEQKIELAKKINLRQFENLSKVESNILQVITNMQKARNDFKNAKTIEEKIAAAKLLTQEPYDLEKLSNALKNVHNMQRVILGLPTDYTKQKIDSHTTTTALTADQAKEMDEFIEANSSKKIENEQKGM